MTSPIAFRASASSTTVLADLGPLQDLPGTWVGTGFNLISRPDKHDNQKFFLEINSTIETLEFAQIGAPIPNRGSAQDDIFFLGVRYLQQVSDAVTKGGLHVEPGLWLNLPATTAPAAPASIVRLATIPHGDALLAQGNALEVAGGPQIQPANSTPITHATGMPVTDPDYLRPFTTTPLPPGIPAGAIANPNLVLTEAIQGQKITETVVLVISTTNVIGGHTGGIQNIPFVVDNADAVSMSAIFWIEKVQDPEIGEFMQLQYTQTILLNFLDIDWPHINVATLVKQ
ncbi:MAG: hypothetical protein JO281_01180 [Pseudonocardiales bacterium]|nr:hypothetical protein [Pseudonocardiales bacterium]